MSLSMYQASVPVFVRALTNLRHVLQKGEAHAKAKNVADAVLLQTRLIPDMLPLVKQVQIACDMACRGSARLAGEEPKSFEDNEATMAEVYSRVDRAIAYAQSFKAEQIDGSESRTIRLKMRSGEQEMPGQSYLLQFILPNLYFHCATTYNLFRSMGVEIGKSDFIGDI
ncbi:DUF1993 domain-containing protein [Rhodanobacter sp. DHG33]|uniref:DUF1993 domain-containing protein n=1 Tax=Rhodanobacter sp. DHG33 TaxID=2775921 RepID=UPI00177EFEBA|nr:DUF1993 domain-containing protein [Rhodanobacter sp. DHG33]MBD8897584.1 DUF1993 domain-containing protein [Rhodanobacter sp. DHG33]